MYINLRSQETWVVALVLASVGDSLASLLGPDFLGCKMFSYKQTYINMYIDLKGQEAWVLALVLASVGDSLTSPLGPDFLGCEMVRGT